MIQVDEVNHIVSPIVRKYDWYTEQLGYGVRLIVTDGEKRASVVITEGEDIEREAMRLIEAVDSHEFKDLEG